MDNIDSLNTLVKRERIVKIERSIYLFSTILFLITVIINVVNIMYYPYLLNGLVLEINILMILLCGYLFIKKQKMISVLEDKRIELKIECILNRN